MKDTMFLVAITRWGARLDTELGPLAQLLGIAAYDARLRLAGPIPVIFARTADPALAESMVLALQARGHGAVYCDTAEIPMLASAPSPRGFELTPEALVLTGAGQPCAPLAWDRIVALIHAQVSTEELTVTRSTKKSFSLGRALVTGGLSVKKTTRRQDRSVSVEREQVVYVVSSAAARSAGQPGPAILLRATQMQYAGLGAEMARTRAACFEILLGILRARAPHARYDRSLVSGKRKPLLIGVTTQNERSHKVRSQSATEAQSNAGPTDIAAHLIALGIAQGQL